MHVSLEEPAPLKETPQLSARNSGIPGPSPTTAYPDVLEPQAVDAVLG